MIEHESIAYCLYFHLKRLFIHHLFNIAPTEVPPTEVLTINLALRFFWETRPRSLGPPTPYGWSAPAQPSQSASLSWHPNGGASFPLMLGQQSPCPSCEKTTPDKSASGVREWLSSPAVQRTFFGGAKGEGVVLSRTARMVLTASQAARRSLSLPSTSLSPSHTSSSGTQNTETSSPPTAKPDATTHIPNQGKPGAHTATHNKGKPVGNMGNIHPHTASMACLSTVRSSKENTSQRQLKRKPNSKSRQNQLNGTTSSKHGKPAVCKRPIATLQHTATVPHPHPSPEPQDTGDLETTCPICGVFFTEEYLPLHAASCQQVATRKLPGGIVTPVPRPFPVSPASLEESMVPCPLCSFKFSLSHIQMHASTCGDPVDPHVIWVD
ncbi:histone H3.v1 isoform X3 [Oncorhynchus nerka]|uniref:histone H3.v1 isoform X3 n=1 Tax=Oncorhynchus nerka TaxID=8023 RepID=UPI0031B859A7